MPGQKPRFERLPGLPPYGERAVPFPSDPRGAFSEGVVVRFFDGADGMSWIGNFGRGYTDEDLVASHPDGHHIIIVSGGYGYIIEPSTRQLVAPFNFYVNSLVLVTEETVVCASHVAICVFTASGSRVSERISWDGFRGLRVVETTVQGEAWSPLSQDWHAFSLDLLTQEVTGGIYSKDMARTVRITKT